VLGGFLLLLFWVTFEPFFRNRTRIYGRAPVSLPEPAGAEVPAPVYQRILVPLNVVQADLAVLSGAELAAKLGRKDDAKARLAAFRKAWPDAEHVGFVTARLKTLDAALAASSR